jgi:hypothetical protein
MASPTSLAPVIRHRLLCPSRVLGGVGRVDGFGDGAVEFTGSGAVAYGGQQAADLADLARDQQPPAV